MATIQELRQKIVDRSYFLSSHAEDEMYADLLERKDVEHALLKGQIEKRLTHDPRGTRYRVAGPARDGRDIRVIVRLRTDGSLIIVTVYAKD